MKPTVLFPKIASFCRDRLQEFDQISTSRKQQLSILSDYLTKKYKANKTPQLIVVCTHNSRRSHLGQLWLAVAADFFDLPALQTFSGGTEATAFNPRAVAAMRRIGFDIQSKDEAAANPVYEIKWAENQAPYLAFSKKYDDEPNPQEAFAAIMVCTDADVNCPIVLGMDLRLALPFDDPKAFDGTELEAQKYEERAVQIGREFLFVLKNVKIN